MSSEFAIEVNDLSKCYQIYKRPQDRLLQMLMGGRKKYHKDFWALKNVSFSIAKGETVGIIGRNGSGKSTLLQMICGTVSPTTGTVRTRGRVAALLELGAGFNAEFTGRENILLNAQIIGIPREQMEDRLEDVLAFSELGDFFERPVKTYSSGMYARLAFSIAIHVDPDILVVDEALAVGDSRFVAKCMRRMREIQEQGATILFVSHDVSSVRTLCKRAIWIDRGKLVENGDVFPVTGKYMEFMFTDELSEQESIRKDIVSVAAAPDADNQVSAMAVEEEVIAQTVEADNEQLVEHVGVETLIAETLPKPSSQTPELDPRPVTHWGSQKGVIVGAAVYSANGTVGDVVEWDTPIEVIVDVRMPLDISREDLCVSFSIKDLKGTDLVVSTTQDKAPVRLPDQECFRICFRLINPLVTGKYVLTVAVEKRMDKDIHYYEYLEGAHYFSSLADHLFFGIFQPKIEQSVEVSK